MTMTHLAQLKDKDIFPDKEVAEVLEWVPRTTVKIVIKNSEGKVALVTNPIHNCFLLPGGGVDDGEEIFAAADRESREEAQCAITSMIALGTIEEFRARDKKHYETHGVFAEVLEKITDDLRTDEEKKNELTVVWLTKDEVVKKFAEQETLLRAGKIDFYNTAFNIVRDHLFFTEACRRGLV
jgi:ADP-ribose pyrophosphatase YjhB (NUDIX family)